jgi:Nose resistant-to-fluoxetine protein, N-terminal domain
VHDSNAKLPVGILRGNIHQYGDFDECLAVVEPARSFRGKFCLANIQLEIPKSMEFLHLMKNQYVAEELVKTTFADVSSSVASMNLLKTRFFV